MQPDMCKDTAEGLEDLDLFYTISGRTCPGHLPDTAILWIWLGHVRARPRDSPVPDMTRPCPGHDSGHDRDMSIRCYGRGYVPSDESHTTFP